MDLFQRVLVKTYPQSFPKHRSGVGIRGKVLFKPTRWGKNKRLVFTMKGGYQKPHGDLCQDLGCSETLWKRR